MKKQISKTIRILIVLFITGIVGVSVWFFSQKTEEKIIVEQHLIIEEELNLTVAGCPTFYYILDKLNDNGINVVETDSTAESFYFFQQGIADLVVAGRILRPDEPEISFEVIGPGYSFISEKELFVLDKQMSEYDFFTDLSIKEIMEIFPYITRDKISEVENVYNYLSKGIIITSVENTDYSKSEIVHIYKEDGSRHRFSRTPIIYYSENTNNLDYIKNLLNNI